MFMNWGEKVTGKYKIKSGDNLTSISSVLGIPTDSLQAFNNIKDPDKIQVGQELLWRRDPSLSENIMRWIFESDKDTQKSRDINNMIQNTITLSAQPEKIESLSFEDFIEDLRISENPKKLGYRNGRWWPFKTANGNIDVGYGIDLSKQTPEYRAKVTKYGLSDDELREDLLERFNTYQDNMKKLFQKNEIDITKVPIKYQRGVLDMLHHLGYTGMSEYKNFFNGIKNNDLDTIRREAKTTFKNKSGKRQVDMKRYNFRLNRYFNNLEPGGIIKAQDEWTSEDIGNPVYKKNWSPKKDKEALEKLKKKRQSQGVQNFDKMARIGYATARLVPGPVGWTTNIIDLVNENAGSGDILATGEPGVNSLANYKAKTSGLLNKPWGKDLLKFSKMFQVYPIRAFDAVFDAKQLYDEITSKK